MLDWFSETMLKIVRRCRLCLWLKIPLLLWPFE